VIVTILCHEPFDLRKPKCIQELRCLITREFLDCNELCDCDLSVGDAPSSSLGRSSLHEGKAVPFVFGLRVGHFATKCFETWTPEEDSSLRVHYFDHCDIAAGAGVVHDPSIPQNVSDLHYLSTILLGTRLFQRPSTCVPDDHACSSASCRSAPSWQPRSGSCGVTSIPWDSGGDCS
jgi:hypothetical protein